MMWRNESNARLRPWNWVRSESTIAVLRGGMEDLFDITQGERFTLLRLLPQDPTSENREGLLDQQIETVLQSLSDVSLLETDRAP